MQVQNSFQFDEKQQYCSKHNQRQIEFICLKQGCDQIFFCNDCFRNDFHEDHCEKVYQIDEIIDAIDEQQLTQNIFEYGQIEAESKIIQEFNILKEKIYQCIDQVQKNIMAKYNNFYENVQSKSHFIKNLQEKLKKFCEKKISQNEISTVIKQIQEQTSNQKLELILNQQYINSISSNILKQIKNLEESIIQGTTVDLPEINQFEKTLKLQSDKRTLNVYGKVDANSGQYDHNFKLNLDYSQTYMINLNLYRNDKFQTNLKLVYPNNNLIYLIQIDSKNPQPNIQQAYANNSQDSNKTQQLLCSECLAPSQQDLKQEINLKNEKNEFQITICLQRNLFIIYDIEQQIYYQPIINRNDLNQIRQQGYFTFMSKPYQQQRSRGVMLDNINNNNQPQFNRILDITKVSSYLYQ